MCLLACVVGLALLYKITGRGCVMKTQCIHSKKQELMEESGTTSGMVASAQHGTLSEKWQLSTAGSVLLLSWK